MQRWRLISTLVATIGLVLATAVIATPAHAVTNILVDVTPQSGNPVHPGDLLDMSVSDPDGEFCAGITDGELVDIYINFYDPDGNPVAYTWDSFTYDTSGDTYSWSDSMYWAWSFYGDSMTHNWDLTTVATCYVDQSGNDVTNPGTPAGSVVEYRPLYLATPEVPQGGHVSLVLTDFLAQGGWCSMPVVGSTVIAADSLADGGASALVHLIPAAGQEVLLPAGWTDGQSGIGLFDESTHSITVDFTVPDTLPAGEYTLALECINAQSTRIGIPAATDLTVTVALPNTGVNLLVYLPWAVGALMLIVIGSTVVIGIRRRHEL